MKNEIIYTAKVWQTAVFAAPILLIVTGTLNTNGTFDDFIQYTVIAAVFGTAFSLPSAVLLFVSTRLTLLKTDMNMLSVKMVLSGIAIILTIIPFIIFISSGTMDNQYTKITMTYTLTIGVAIWLYKLQRVSVAL